MTEPRKHLVELIGPEGTEYSGLSIDGKDVRLVDITGIDAIERSLRADLRAAVEALEGRCHDGEGLGCETNPCVENVGRDEVLALLADPVVVGVVVNEAGL